MIIKMRFMNEDYLFHMSGVNPLYELIDRNYLVSEVEIIEVETSCEEKLKDAFSPEMIYEAIDEKATFGLYDKDEPYDGWYDLSSKSLEEAKKDFEKILNDGRIEGFNFAIFDFENVKIIDIKVKKDISIKKNDDVYVVKTENCTYSGNKKKIEDIIFKIMDKEKISLLDVFSYFKIYKNGEEIYIKDFAPVLP